MSLSAPILKFNEELEIPELISSSPIYIDQNFINESTRFGSMIVDNLGVQGGFTLSYQEYTHDTGVKITVYSNEQAKEKTGFVGWKKEKYRYVTYLRNIADDHPLKTWVEDNAIDIADEVTLIFYGKEHSGDLVASLRKGQQAILPCSDKIMQDNIIVRAPK